MVRQIGENPKVCVYAICKNEEKFIPRWIESLREADYIVVLDTGSTDNSVQILKGYSPLVHVEQKVYDDFRFDVARNDSMKLIPKDADICVVSDLDHVFRPGWKETLIDAFKRGVDEVYGPIIDYTDDNEIIKWFLSKNVHPNDPRWYWERPIHEGVFYHPDENDPKEIVAETIDSFVIEHHQDTKKDRSFYLDMLEKEYLENASDPMCMIYYGCELSFHGRNDAAREVFLKGYNECDFTDHPDVWYQNCVNLALSYKEINEYETALKFALESFDSGITTRRNIMCVANILKDMGDFDLSLKFMKGSLKFVTEMDKSWKETKEYFEGKVYKELGDLYRGVGIAGPSFRTNYYSLAKQESNSNLYDEDIKTSILQFIENEFGGGNNE